MQGLAHAMMLAASLRGGMLLAPASPPMANVPTIAPFDKSQWGQPIAPGRNPLDHDLLHRPQEAKDKVWQGPYMGGAPLIFTGPRVGTVFPQDIASSSTGNKASTHPAYRGSTPDGNGFTRDATWWPTIDGLSMVRVPNHWSPPTVVATRRGTQPSADDIVGHVDTSGR